MRFVRMRPAIMPDAETRRQLIAETDEWRRLATAIGRMLSPNEA